MKNQKNFESLLAQGLRDFEAGLTELALDSFRHAIVADFSRPDAWFWMGRVHEDAGDRVLAGHCFYRACDMRAGFPQAKAALRRLGYIKAPLPQPAVDLDHQVQAAWLLRLP